VLATRLPEAAASRLLDALAHHGHSCRYDELDTLWSYPLASAMPTEEKSP
jgi:hypothetical protein